MVEIRKMITLKIKCILYTNKERHGVLRHGDSKKHDIFFTEDTNR